MFRRTESARERVLLRLIVEQQSLIRNLADRLAAISGHPVPPPLMPGPEPESFEEQYMATALEGIPPTMHGLEVEE